jgi:thiol:disulfide interchange protein DsbC
MKKPLSLILAALLACTLAWPLAAEDGTPRAVTELLERIIPESPPDAVRRAEIDGFYEVSYGTDILYISADGRYLLRGDVYDMRTEANLTESRRAAYRLGLFSALKAEDLVVFAPKGRKPRHVVHVFTDVDCSFCRRLQREMPRYNELGIEVRYLAFPRSGPDTPSYHKIVSVWCADDPLDAMTRAKAGEAIPVKSCPNPVLDHMELGIQIGVRGTPTFVLGDGTTLPGFVSPDRLAEYLNVGSGD